MLYQCSTLPSPYATLPLKTEGKKKEYSYRCQSQLKFSSVTSTSLTQAADPTLCLTHFISVRKNCKWPGKNILERGESDRIITITVCHFFLPNSPTICPRHDIDSCVQDTENSLPQAPCRRHQSFICMRNRAEAGKRIFDSVKKKKGVNMKCLVYQRD